jgi:hypothetical protein
MNVYTIPTIECMKISLPQMLLDGNGTNGEVNSTANLV